MRSPSYLKAKPHLTDLKCATPVDSLLERGDAVRICRMAS